MYLHLQRHPRISYTPDILPRASHAYRLPYTCPPLSHKSYPHFFTVESLCAITSTVLFFVISSRAAFNFFFIFRVHKSSSLVQNNNWRILQNRTCQRNSLALPSGQLLSAVSRYVSIPSGSLFRNSSHCALFAALSTSSLFASGFPIRIFSYRLVLNKKCSCET